jgi:hypothetical protein
MKPHVMHECKVVSALQGIVHLTEDILTNPLSDVQKLSIQVGLIQIAALHALRVLDSTPEGDG